MAETCPGCKKSFRNLRTHLALSSRCPEALEYRAQSPTQEPEPGQELGQEQEPVMAQAASAPPISPQAGPAGLTLAEVGALVSEVVGLAVAQMNEAINNRLAAERQATQQQFEQVGPAVLTYLQAQAAKETEQTKAQQTAPPSAGQSPPQGEGGDGLTQLASILSMFTKPAGGGLEQIAETIGSIGKLADAMDALRYRPWRDGVDFATQNILQRTRMPGGPTPEGAAEDLEKSMKNSGVFGRPTLPVEGKP